MDSTAMIHALVPLVSPATFHDLPTPLPLDLVTAKHVTPNSLKHSLTLRDLQDQPGDPIDFCLSLGAFHLLEQYTRAHLPSLSPTLPNAHAIMRLWSHRLTALVALDLAHIALAETRSLDLVHHPLAPLHLQLAAARLPALANDPLRALDLLSKVATRHLHDTEPTPTSSYLPVLAAYRHMIAVAAWHLSDPRLVSHLITQAMAKLGGQTVDPTTVPDPTARAQWWFHVALARMAVTQLAHADHALAQLDQELGSGAALVQFARATLLSLRGQSQPGQGAAAAAAWTSLWNQVVGTARRIRAFESTAPTDQPRLSPRLPSDFAPLAAAASDPAGLAANPATYAADCAWLTPVLAARLLPAIANNRLAATVYHAVPKPQGQASTEDATAAHLVVDWTLAAKWGVFADAPIVGNLASWIEVTPNGSVAGEPVSVMDRKRDVIKAMVKVTDAPCVAALRMG